MASNMRWHKDKRIDDGVLRHLADAEAWKEFDNMHSSFTQDPRSCNPNKKKQGRTRNIAFAKKRKAGVKVPMDIPLLLMQAVGNNAQALITELGVIVSNRAPLQCTKWKAIPNYDKKTMWQEAKRDSKMGKEPSRTDMWFTTRFSSKKKAWVDPRSQEVYEELRRIELEEGDAPMIEDDRFEAMLRPERSAYIRGHGAGPKQTTFKA
ncbi:hypothetical protein L1049_007977 [Liquidambar formosana]|uniref:Uncharacterized protein n=1 Tax=Liquidambar formosana TaxID=63359 RepID=A0AAP0S8Q8_LIQFO